MTLHGIKTCGNFFFKSMNLGKYLLGMIGGKILKTSGYFTYGKAYGHDLTLVG